MTVDEETVQLATGIAIKAYERLRPPGSKFWGELDDMTRTLAIASARDGITETRPSPQADSALVEERAAEILNRHLEYTDGLNRGQYNMKVSNALAAVVEALSLRSGGGFADGVEAAAKVAEQWAGTRAASGYRDKVAQGIAIATTIRALTPKENEGGL